MRTILKTPHLHDKKYSPNYAMIELRQTSIKKKTFMTDYN